MVPLVENAESNVAFFAQKEWPSLLFHESFSCALLIRASPASTPTRRQRFRDGWILQAPDAPTMTRCGCFPALRARGRPAPSADTSYWCNAAHGHSEPQFAFFVTRYRDGEFRFGNANPVKCRRPPLRCIVTHAARFVQRSPSRADPLAREQFTSGQRKNLAIFRGVPLRTLLSSRRRSNF